jgi:hypothetical protein
MTMRRALCFIFFVLLPLTCAAAMDALIKLPNFDGLADKASESITITLDEQLLKVAARFLSSDDPKDDDARKFLSGLRGIYVRSFTFRDDFVYPKTEIDAIRKQLTAPAWNQLIDVRSAKEQANVGIYVSLDAHNNANGLVIISTEPRQLTIVNIVGAIDLERLKNIEGKFGIPKMDIDVEKAKKK